MASSYKPISACRVSGSSNLIPILNLGDQALTGVFPHTPEEPVAHGPLELVWCPESGLVQLAHTFDSTAMYGEGYGYRSGLNASMVRHLSEKVAWLERRFELTPGDVVLDIGSNDGTTLRAFSVPGLHRIGIDPSAAKFRPMYGDEISLVPEYFSASRFWSSSSRPAKLVTSIAMFYDLDDPVAFAREVASVLRPDGVWHFEQSYLPSMLDLNSYDTVCHEHLEYYSLHVVLEILDKADLQVLDVTLNDVNGGSFAVTAGHRSRHPDGAADATVEALIGAEDAMDFWSLRPFQAFRARTEQHRARLTLLLSELRTEGKTVLGYGASTKGNVTLQYCGITPNELPAIADVNPEKYGCVTPGTGIPIISEADARRMQPDYFLVLPWHFRRSIIEREQEFLQNGGRLLFPFPEIEIV